MAKECFLTTIDNPYSPFDDFENWLKYDTIANHNCCQLMAHFAHTSEALSEQDNLDEIDRAVDEVIRLDPSNLYTKVVKDI